MVSHVLCVFILVFFFFFFTLRANKYERGDFKSPQMSLKVGVANLYSTVRVG